MPQVLKFALTRSFKGICVSILWVTALHPVLAYTPDSPVVVDMVERGIQFLEKSVPSKAGESMLVAYAHHKVRQDANHPLVRNGLQAAVEIAEAATRGGLPNLSEINYEAAVAILLMIDIDPAKYQRQIQGLGKAVIAEQKSHGGFGYLNEQLGDTSQTQYCILALWSMDQAGLDVPKASMDKAIQWLLRTQDPSGRWGYKGVDSGRIGNLVPQDSLQSYSLTSAGAGSVLIGGDFFGTWRGSREIKPDIEDFPPALTEQRNLAELKEKRESFKTTPETLMTYITRTENFFSKSSYDGQLGRGWHYYYIYTLERYRSFLELSLGKQEKEPQWYNQVVDELVKLQAPNGAWADATQAGASTNSGISTAFSILFLIRSTKKAIGDLSEGIVSGGWELPKDTTNIRVDGTQIKAKPVVTAVTDLLGMLEGDGADGLEKGSIPENLKLSDDPKQRLQQLSRLQRLARGSDSYQARRVATRLLGQSDSLEVVPTLIFGLTDPDEQVRIYARDGLRFISRRIDGFGMPSKPTPDEIDKAVKSWRGWYTKFDPGYVFLDE